MFHSPSLFGLIACVLYGITAFSACCARCEASASRQQRWHVNTWALIAIFFFLLMISRFTGIEDMVRSLLREILQRTDMVASRRSLQGPIIAIAIVMFSSATMYFSFWVSQHLRGRLDHSIALAIGACWAMVALIGMRIASFHALDVLLTGPLKLNWFADVGSSLLVLLATFVYRRAVNESDRNVGRTTGSNVRS